MAGRKQIAAYGFFGAVFGGIVGGRMMNDGLWGYVVQAMCGAGGAVAAFVVAEMMARVRTRAKPAAR